MCDPIKEAVLLPEFLWILLVGITVPPSLAGAAVRGVPIFYLVELVCSFESVSTNE